MVAATIIPSCFEDIVAQLNLSPTQYATSAELKEWVRRHKDSKYVPTALLDAWGFTVRSEG